MGLPNSIRIPATPENRSYLKLLRRAEEAWWKTTGVQEEDSTPGNSLPSADHSETEDWLMGIMAIISLATVSYVIMDSTRLLESWSGFVTWVRFAVGA
jgi:hypothetical protein